MKKYFKKFTTVPLLFALMVTASSVPMTTTTYAADAVITSQPNVGVSITCPDDSGRITTRGVSKPSKTWDVSSDGEYDFSGTSTYPTLYTNYKFYGQTGYTVYVENTGKYSITVKAKAGTKTYASSTIAAGDDGSFTFSDIKADKEFYLSFDGAGDNSFSFSGYIE